MTFFDRVIRAIRLMKSMREIAISAKFHSILTLIIAPMGNSNIKIVFQTYITYLLFGARYSIALLPQNIQVRIVVKAKHNKVMSII